MVKRDMIRIDYDECDGCGSCIPNCPEGAIQIIDGKARLVGEALCDGLGACVGHCPRGAMTVEKRDAPEYDEYRVMENIVKQGMNVVAAHLKHLDDHGQKAYLDEALKFLRERGIEPPPRRAQPVPGGGRPHAGCEGWKPPSRLTEKPSTVRTGSLESRLRQWPVQLKLVPPAAPYFREADLLIAADCVAFAHGGFHSELLKDKALIVFCPKLDEDTEGYVDKLSDIMKLNDVASVTIAHMEVPCCFGTDRVVDAAIKKSGRRIPVETKIISVQGDTIESQTR
jgi:NAD-dependent dihydropyrimidine dehydrogenase PreA subunit